MKKIMTQKQLEKECKAIAKDMIGDGFNLDECAYDTAKSMLFMDGSEYRDFLNAQGIDPKNHAEALAEYIVC